MSDAEKKLLIDLTAERDKYRAEFERHLVMLHETVKQRAALLAALRRVECWVVMARDGMIANAGARRDAEADLEVLQEAVHLAIKG